jgi:SAM-dependent methyltransferase
MTDAFDWRGKVGHTWASEWQRTDRSFAALDAELIWRAGAMLSRRNKPVVADIGCGAGATALGLARRMPDARITGIDLAGSLIAVAQSRLDGLGNCRFEEQDATIWSGPDAPVDLFISRHGVMFFDDPVAAFAHLSALAGQGADFIFSCFRDRALNDWANILATAPPSDAPGPFAFADAARVEAILTDAGWSNVQAHPVDFDYVVGGGTDPVADAISFFKRIGPAASILAAAAGDERQALLDRLSDRANKQLIDGQVVFRAAAWIWTARKGEPQ